MFQISNWAKGPWNRRDTHTRSYISLWLSWLEHKESQVATRVTWCQEKEKARSCTSRTQDISGHTIHWGFVWSCSKSLPKIRNRLYRATTHHHPKSVGPSKVNLDETPWCVYRIPCKNCDKVYIEETGRSFEVRMKEHQKEVEAQEGRKYARSSMKQSQSKQNKSAITDHVNQENHVINWNEATIIARDSDKTTRWIREAVKIRQESQGVMNRDEGNTR